VIPINSFVEGADIYLTAKSNIISGKIKNFHEINALDDIRDLMKDKEYILSAEFFDRTAAAAGRCEF
jgi:hypothetical protein